MERKSELPCQGTDTNPTLEVIVDLSVKWRIIFMAAKFEAGIPQTLPINWVNGFSAESVAAL